MMPVTRSFRKFMIAVYSVILLALSGCYDPYYVDGDGDGYQSSYGGTVVSYQQPWYDYDYYPSSGVYFNYGTGYYYHHDHGRWRHVRRLPRHIHINQHDRVHLRMRGDRPYLKYNEHRRKYKGYRKNDKHRYRDDRYRSEQKHDRQYERDYKDERKHDKRDYRDERKRDGRGHRDKNRDNKRGSGKRDNINTHYTELYKKQLKEKDQRRKKKKQDRNMDERKHDKRSQGDGNRVTKRGSSDPDNIDTHYYELYKKQLNEKNHRRKKKKQERNRDELKHDKRSQGDVGRRSKRGSSDPDNIDTRYYELYKKQSKEEAQRRKEKKKKKKKQEQERDKDKNRESEKNAKNSGWYLQK